MVTFFTVIFVLFVLFFSQNHTKNPVHRLLSPWKQQWPGCLWEPHVQHQHEGCGREGCSIRSQPKYCLHHGLTIDYPHLNLMTQISNGTTLCTRLWKQKLYASTQASTHCTLFLTITKGLHSQFRNPIQWSSEDTVHLKPNPNVLSFHLQRFCIHKWDLNK